MKTKLIVGLITATLIAILSSESSTISANSCGVVKQTASVVLSSPGSCVFPTRRKNGRVSGIREFEATIAPPTGNVCKVSDVKVSGDGNNNFGYDDAFAVSLNRALLISSHLPLAIYFPESGDLDIWDDFSTIDQKKITSKGPNKDNPNRKEHEPVCAGGIIGSHLDGTNACFVTPSEKANAGFSYQITDDVGDQLGQFLENATDYTVRLHATGDDHITKDCVVSPIRVELTFDVVPDNCSCNFDRPIDLTTIGGPVYSQDYVRQVPDIFLSQFNIQRKDGGESILSYDDYTYLSNALVINQGNNVLQEPSSINSQLNTYTNSNPLNNQVNSLFNYYLNRASTKRSTTGVNYPTYQSASEVVKQISGDGIVGTPLLDSTPNQNGENEIVFYGNLSLPASLQELDVSVSNSRCAEDAVHLINGDLHIAPPFFASDLSNEAVESYCVFIVKGDLYIEPGLDASESTGNYDIIEAFFVVDGSTYIMPDSGDSLYIRGGLITENVSEIDQSGNILNGTSGFKRERSTGLTPTHLIEYDPSFVFTHVGLIGARQYSLREL